MSSSRVLGIAMVLLFVAVSVHKTVQTLEARAPAEAQEAAERAPLRRFWEAYRTASQRRVSGNLEAAITGYREALALKPDHEDSLYYLGNCYLESRRYPEAVATYRRLIASNPRASSRGYIQLGLVYACLDPREPGGLAPTFDLNRAGRSFRRSRQMDPENFGSLLGLGEVALLRGDWQQASATLKSANADNPSSVAAAYLLGYLCWRKDERAEGGTPHSMQERHRAGAPTRAAWRWFRLAVQRCKVKKLPIQWTQEGDLKASPELRWRALAHQSITGEHWLRLRRYVGTPGLSPAVMESEYRRLQGALTAAQKHSRTA